MKALGVIGISGLTIGYVALLTWVGLTVTEAYIQGALR